MLSEMNLDEIIKDHYPEFRGVHPSCIAVPMCSQEDYDRLTESIRTYGLAEPLIRTKDGLLLDGRTRLLACYEVGKDIIIHDDNGVVDPWVISKNKNIDRRHLSPGQKAIFAAAWMEHETAAAKERQKGGQGGVLLEETFPQANGTNKREPQARDKAGDAAGVSGKSVGKAKALIENAPDLADSVKRGDQSLESATKELKSREKAAQSHPAEITPETPTKEMTRVITAAGVVSEIALPKKVVFNSTTDAVDWAKWTWNPVTGCEHGCKFCYAREIANSKRMKPYYPIGFEPTYHEYRLAAPLSTHKPDSDDPTAGRVFVCSMADLFGKWVPNGWIRSVFEACEGSPEWEYLFLTKWPARYSSMPLLPGAWYGASVIQQSDVLRVEKSMKKFDTPESVKWVSLEPMTSPIVFRDLSWCDLMVIGSQTSTTQPGGVHVPEIAPEFDWIVDVVNQCRDAGVPYYLKANLGMVRPGMKLPKPLPRGK